MSVRQRGSSYQYRFTLDGKAYSGACKGCTSKRSAELYEASVREELANIHRQKTVTALVENYKFELTGGKPITLPEAFKLAAAKPSKRKATSSYARLREVYWNDFVQYLSKFNPEVVDLSQIRRLHCENYVSYLIENGRFVREVAFTLTTKRRKKQVS